MNITQRQLNIVTNDANSASDGAERSAMITLACRLWPEDEARIREAYTNHPINVRWEEYSKASTDRSEFLLPENI